MNKSSITELIVLAALWGGSFICLRIASPEFGSTPLIFLRVMIASLVLAPFALNSNILKQAQNSLYPLFWMGLFMCAVPFTLFAYAANTLEAGVMVVINSTSPIWASLISSKVNGYRSSKMQWIGMMIGLFGVVLIVWEKLDVRHDEVDSIKVTAALGACIGAAICYGIGSSISKRYLQNITPINIAFGSMFCASLVLLMPALYNFPNSLPSISAWLALTVLSTACTAFAALLFFRLIKSIGGEKAIMVTYLQPIFGMVWGIFLLNESVSEMLIFGSMVIFLGIALATRAD